MTWPHIILILFLSFLSKANAVCYFPVELQGIFATQSTLSGGGTHKYSQITILPEAIPVWGVCHEMFGESVVLRDDTGGQACFRCFQVATHSPNVIQVFTEGLDKCYLNSGAARASCPSKDDIKNRIAREIMLYKSRSFTRDGQIDRLMCPFSGKFHFTYDVNDGTENTIECPDAKSVITNCPNGSELQLRFSQCRFRDTNMALQCLGHWKGVDGFQYFALWDTRVTSEDQPQYRCAMYHKEADTGRVFIGFSVDATCTNRLHSPWDGYETMVLTPTKKPSPPAPIHSHSCTFPQWSFGKWKTMQIDGRKLIWKDLHRDKYYEALCLAQNKERFAIYTLNQCGQEEYTCIWIKSRDVDVFEYKIASVQYNYFNNTHLCSDDVFVGQKWRTEGRLSDSKNKNCPVLGEYEGIIPDAPELCAKLTSNCRNPALMHYTVFSCGNSSQVYETSQPRVKRGIFRITNPRELLAKNRRKFRLSRPDRRFRAFPSLSRTIRRNLHTIRNQRPRRRSFSPLKIGSHPSYVFTVSPLSGEHQHIRHSHHQLRRQSDIGGRGTSSDEQHVSFYVGRNKERNGTIENVISG